MLEISESKVQYLLTLTRELEVKVLPSTDTDTDEDSQLDLAVLEAHRNDPVVQELDAFFEDLNEDEELDLVALMWVGRGTYDADDFAEARAVARTERTHSTQEYLLGTPLLADHLEDGLTVMLEQTGGEDD